MFHQITQVLEMSHAGKNYMFDSPEASLSFDRSYYVVGREWGGPIYLLCSNTHLLIDFFPVSGSVYFSA